MSTPYMPSGTTSKSDMRRLMTDSMTERFCAAAAKHIRFRFVKVKGHSGDKYNDLADRLAKDALGIQ